MLLLARLSEPNYSMLRVSDGISSLTVVSEATQPLHAEVKKVQASLSEQQRKMASLDHRVPELDHGLDQRIIRKIRPSLPHSLRDNSARWWFGGSSGTLTGRLYLQNCRSVYKKYFLRQHQLKRTLHSYKDPKFTVSWLAERMPRSIKISSMRQSLQAKLGITWP